STADCSTHADRTAPRRTHDKGTRHAVTLPPGAREDDLEVEVADVVRVEDEGVSEEHAVVGADLERTELARLERVALGAGDLTRDECRRRECGEVAEVSRVPQREGRDGAVLDVLAHLVRGAE